MYWRVHTNDPASVQEFLLAIKACVLAPKVNGVKGEILHIEATAVVERAEMMPNTIMDDQLAFVS